MTLERVKDERDDQNVIEGFDRSERVDWIDRLRSSHRLLTDFVFCINYDVFSLFLLLFR